MDSREVANQWANKAAEMIAKTSLGDFNIKWDSTGEFFGGNKLSANYPIAVQDKAENKASGLLSLSQKREREWVYSNFNRTSDSSE